MKLWVEMHWPSAVLITALRVTTESNQTARNIKPAVTRNTAIPCFAPCLARIAGMRGCPDPLHCASR